MAAHHHEHLVVVLDDVPQFAALITELDRTGLSVGAVLQVVGGDDGGAVGVLLQHRTEPGFVLTVPSGVVVGARSAACTGQGDDQVIVAARPQEHIGAVAVTVGRLGEIPAGAAGPGSALAGEAVIIVVGAAGPAVVVAHLHQEFDARVRQAVEGVPGVDILGVIVVVIHHVAQVDNSGHIQRVSAVDEAVNGVVHHIGAEFHHVLGIGDEDDVIVVLVPELIVLVAAEVFHIVLRVGDKPILFLQRCFGDTDLLQAALEELVQAVPPGGAHAEAAVGGVGVHPVHIAADIVPEGLAAVDIGGDLLSVGDHGDVVPHTALIHGHRPGGAGHGMVSSGIAGDELDLLAVGDGGIHGALLSLRVAAVGALAADKAHPLVCGGPVLGEVVDKLHGVAIGERLFVDSGSIHSDEVHTGFGIVVAVQHHAAARTGHAAVVEGDILLLIAVVVDLHFQVVVVSALVLDDQIALRNAAAGICLVKFPVCCNAVLVQSPPGLRLGVQPVGGRLRSLLPCVSGLRRQCGRTPSQGHQERQETCCESLVQILHFVWPLLREYDAILSKGTSLYPPGNCKVLVKLETIPGRPFGEAIPAFISLYGAGLRSCGLKNFVTALDNGAAE